MAAKAQDVKRLRDQTGAGMLDCKKALEQADGDFAAAEKLLKEWGLAAVAKRSGRATEEGRIFTFVGSSAAGICELSCETDFVARNDEFINAGTSILKYAVEQSAQIDSPSVVEMVNDLATKIKENIVLRRMEMAAIAANQLVSAYVHGEGGSVGVLVTLQVGGGVEKTNEKVLTFARDCALHAAAFAPSFLNQASVAATYIAEQTSIFAAQAQAMGKPANVTEGIVKGKLNKHLAEVCFVDQPFVKDDKRTVAAVAKDLGRDLGGSVEVVGFRYYRVGEGN